MKSIKQTVYLPVKVEDDKAELQKEIDYWYDQTGSLTSETIVKRAYSLGLGKGIKAVEGYFFTPEQFNEYTQNVIKQSLKIAAQNVDMDIDFYNSLQEGSLGNIDKESITNTSKQTFEKWKI